MSIEQIKYFYNIAKYKNITKVAKSLHISQPALSQQMQKLENTLGHKLFERSNKGAELTDMGKIVYKYSEKIIDIYSRMIDELDYKATNHQTVRIEACCSLDDYYLTKILCDSDPNIGNIRYKLYSQTPELIMEHLKNGICDIGFMCEPFSDKDYICKEIGKIEFILFASNEYPIPDEIDIDELYKHPFTIMNEKYEFRSKLIRNLESIGIDTRKLNIIFELGSFEAIKKAVASSIGIAFLPDIALTEELDYMLFKKIKVRSPKLVQRFNIIYKKLPIHPSIQYFVKYFNEKIPYDFNV